MDADGSNQRRLTEAPGEDSFPAWSPDGSTIAFTSDRVGNVDIWVMAVDGSGQISLTADSPANDWGPTWSPDGRHLAFAYDRDRPADHWQPYNRYQLYVIDAEGGSLTRLTDVPGTALTPAWQP